MNHLEKKRSGFTLIEIVVVLVIIGVIAVMAFPGIFGQIERHRGQEALNTMNYLRSAIESCGVENNYDFSQCTTWTSISAADPSNAAGNTGANFNYRNAGTPTTLLVCGGHNAFASGTYSITAIRAPDTGCGAANKIIMDRSTTGVVCQGYGNFIQFC